MSSWRTVSMVLAALGVAGTAIWALSTSASERSYAATVAGAAIVTPNPTPSVVVVATSAPVTPTTHQAATKTVSTTWVQKASARTGIPERALRAYASAQLVVAAEDPHCGIGWNTLAGIGWVESGHGSHDGAALLETGYSDRPILGPVLSGGIHAVGPMQFIPSTWRRWGSDGNGDGVADPNQIDDAALSAARYLCASGSLRSAATWRQAVFSYNHSQAYVDKVAAVATSYSARMR